MAPRSVLETCDWTATSAKFFGRYLRASARDITRREYPRPDGATKDTACRCYLRGPDGVSGLAPSGTWGTVNIALVPSARDSAAPAAEHLHPCYPLPAPRYSLRRCERRDVTRWRERTAVVACGQYTTRACLSVGSVSAFSAQRAARSRVVPAPPVRRRRVPSAYT